MTCWFGYGCRNWRMHEDARPSETREHFEMRMRRRRARARRRAARGRMTDPATARKEAAAELAEACAAVTYTAQGSEAEAAALERADKAMEPLRARDTLTGSSDERSHE